MKESDSDVKNELEIFMENVVFLRKTHGYSKRKMAELLCISIGTLNKIETGVFPKQLDVDVFWQVADVFRVSPSRLFVSHDEW